MKVLGMASSLKGLVSVWLGRRLEPFAIVVVGGGATPLRTEPLAAGRAGDGYIGHSLTRCDIKSNI
jgi:hypothetical protein